METVSIIQLHSLSKSVYAQIKAAQMEAAEVWNMVNFEHRAARVHRTKWPGMKEFQRLTKGVFDLNAQMVQQIWSQYLANVDATRKARLNGNFKARYPHKDKRFFPLMWPAQAVCYRDGRVVLPMGRGNPSLVFKVDLPEGHGAIKLVFNRTGYELHVVCSTPAAEPSEGTATGAVDLGEIHLATAVTNTGKALVVSGRGIRSLKRLRHKMNGRAQQKLARRRKRSRKWWRTVMAKKLLAARIERRIRDQRHKATRQVIDFFDRNGVSRFVIGNPDGVRKRNCGRKHNQRMSGWQYGKDIDYLDHKAEMAGMVCFTGDERGTSSRCPHCGHRHKPRGRNWTCKKCGFSGHRDVVGGTNIHGKHITPIDVPRSITYRRPAPSRVPKVVVAQTRANVVSLCTQRHGTRIAGVAQATAMAAA